MHLIRKGEQAEDEGCMVAQKWWAGGYGMRGYHTWKPCVQDFKEKLPSPNQLTEYRTT